MPYIPFTEEQKLRANNVNLVEFLRRACPQTTASL